MIESQFRRPSGPYFLSHSVGLQPIAAEAALAQSFLEPWGRGDARAWDAWLETIDRFRSGLARIIGARKEDVSPQTNISSALGKILHALPPREGRRRIVLAEDDFPTVGFVFEQARRAGYEVAFLQGGPRLADPEAWREGVAEDVDFLHVTHVFSNLGLKTPVADIVARARAQGVRVIVDVAQSAGAVAVDADRWGADFITGTSVKYLCGGPGAAFLWVNPSIAPACRPVDVGWFSHENPFEFDIRNFRYAPNADRFWGGTPSVAPYAIAAAGQAIIADTGVATIERGNQALLDRLLATLPEEAFLSHTTPGERGSSFILVPRDIHGARLALAEEGFVFDERKGGLRLSVHFYNSEAEIDLLIGALQPFV